MLNDENSVQSSLTRPFIVTTQLFIVPVHIWSVIAEPPELTSENIVKAVEGVWWKLLGICLSIPESKLDEIQRLYSDDSKRCQPLIHHWLDLDPSPSWRRVITALDNISWIKGSEIADRIRSYAEPLTGMFSYHQQLMTPEWASLHDMGCLEEVFRPFTSSFFFMVHTY